MSKKRIRHININNGDVLACASGNFFYLTCCDCCLTHKINISVVGKEARLGIFRDDRRTSQKRRRKREVLE